MKNKNFFILTTLSFFISSCNLGFINNILDANKAIISKEIFDMNSKYNINFSTNDFISLQEVNSLEEKIKYQISIMEKNELLTNLGVEELKKTTKLFFTNLKNNFTGTEILIYPKEYKKINLRSYCLDKGIPAPKSGEKMIFKSIDNFICPGLSSIYKDLMKLSQLYPDKQSDIQGLVWNIRTICNSPESKIIISENQKKLLDESQENGYQNFINYHQGVSLLKGLGKNLLDSLIKIDDSSQEKFTDSIEKSLKELEKKPVVEEIPNDNSQYSVIYEEKESLKTLVNKEKKVVVSRVVSQTGGASEISAEIVNNTDKDFIFDSKNYALSSQRTVQNLGISGSSKVYKSDCIKNLNNFNDMCKKLINVQAHRGLESKYPENTKSSFKGVIDYNNKAKSMGKPLIDTIETDVQITKDGQLVLFHDNDKMNKLGFSNIEEGLGRTTDIDSREDLKSKIGLDINFRDAVVSDYTLEELKSLNIIKDGKVTGEKIPTLQELFDIVNGNSIKLNLELKSNSFEIEKKLLDQIKNNGISKNVTISSFDRLQLIKIKNIDPNIRTSLLVSNFNEPILEYINDSLADEVNFPLYIKNEIQIIDVFGSDKFKNNIIKLKELGKEINFWDNYYLTKNFTEENLTKLFEDFPNQIDGIITGNPELVFKTLNKICYKDKFKCLSD